MKKKIVVLSGAGISAESGIQTFRDGNGLWNNHKIEEVCTPEAWAKDPTMVNDFYNMRRIEVLNAQPNKAHIDLAKVEDEYDVVIVTQNVDDLHERGGSTNIIHLHGEILKARSSNPCYDWAGISPDPKINNFKTYPVGRKGLTMNDMADDGFPLRPHIVWFGESVPKLVDAVYEVEKADALIVVGTSLNVYPAASLIYNANCPIWYVDPNVDLDTQMSVPARIIRSKATTGIELALNQIKEYFLKSEIKKAVDSFIGKEINDRSKEQLNTLISNIIQKYNLQDFVINYEESKVTVTVPSIELFFIAENQI